MRRGFTLIEIFSTVFIMAVIAAIAFPNYAKTIQKGEANRAVVNLRAIRLAQKIYYAKNGTYACVSSCANAAAIKTALGVEITDGKFVYSVAATATTFTATATGYSATLTLNETGTSLGGTYTPKPAYV